MGNIITTDIKNALAGKAYLSALALALTIPDICTKEKGRKAYCTWYNQYFVYNSVSDVNYSLTDKECYALRCSFLHEMKTDIGKQPVLEKELKNKKMEYTFKIANGNVQYVCWLSENEKVIYLSVNIFVNQMLRGYEKFLKDNPSFEAQFKNIKIDL